MEGKTGIGQAERRQTDGRRGYDSFITTRELAERLDCEIKTIFNAAKKCLPEKSIENGKPTLWTEAEATLILEELKSHNSNQHGLVSSLQGTSTNLTPSLRMMEAFKMFQEAANEEIERLRRENDRQKAVIEEQQPKVDFYDDVTGSADTVDMKEAAKILNFKGVGRNKLFEILRDKGILDGRNQPYQRYVDAGYFRVVESRWQCGSDVKVNLKTVVSQKGLEFIGNVLREGRRA